MEHKKKDPEEVPGSHGKTKSGYLQYDVISTTELSGEDRSVGAPNPGWEGQGILPKMVTLSWDKKNVVETVRRKSRASYRLSEEVWR